MNDNLKKEEKEMFISIYGEEEFEKLEEYMKSDLAKQRAKADEKMPYTKRPESIRAEIDRENNLKQRNMENKIKEVAKINAISKPEDKFFILDNNLDEDIYTIKNNLKERNMEKDNINDSKLEFRINENEITDEFNRIAKLLLLQKRLKINNVLARFTEIEFYYYCQQHDDNYTHEHTLNEGRWRLHNQGIDITLKGSSGFGGILIRGIEINDEYINGPRRVLFKIMDFLNPVNEVQNNFGLIDGDILAFQIFQTYRHGLVSPSGKMLSQNSELFLNANYRYIVTPQKFSKKQFVGAEQIAQRFDDRDLAIKFLGYNLNK